MFIWTHKKPFSISGSTECMGWKVRFKVAVGVAEGLQYLHHDCHRRIIHRDIKASNILLTKNYEAQVLLSSVDFYVYFLASFKCGLKITSYCNMQISDFGLAKWLPEKWTHHVVFPIEGTFGLGIQFLWFFFSYSFSYAINSSH